MLFFLLVDFLPGFALSLKIISIFVSAFSRAHRIPAIPVAFHEHSARREPQGRSTFSLEL
jgi:hypothetical protein